MSGSHPFPIYSGILEPEHYKKIGSAIWLFLWCISATTKEVEKDGVVWGIVLGNKPLKLNELAEKFGVNEKTIRRWLDALEENEYIKITRVAYGLIITVRNSKKFKERVDKNVHSGTDKNVHSDNPDRTKMSILEPRDRTDMSTHPDKNVHSKKDITEINNNTTDATEDKEDDVDKIANRFIDLKTAQKGQPCRPTARDYEAIKRVVAAGVPIPTTIRLLEQCFSDYTKEQPNGVINSFRYCEQYIMDRYKTLMARKKVREEVKRSAKPTASPQKDRPRYNYGF